MAPKYIEDVALSDELAGAIGHMVIQWGHLEDNAICLAALLLGANHYEFRSAGVTRVPDRVLLAAGGYRALVDLDQRHRPWVSARARLSESQAMNTRSIVRPSGALVVG